MKGELNVKSLHVGQFLDHFDDSVDMKSLGFRGILKASTVSWVYLPEDVLIIIFKMLNGKDLANVVKVCSRWRMLGNAEDLWEKKFKEDFHIDVGVTLRPGAHSWKKEYERLSDNVPCVELDKIEEHGDEVLHVSFSHNGMMFCTCSKDAYVKVYNADWPFNTVFSAHHGGNKSFLNWKYTQLSQFSPCDTQLLVSGRNDVSELGGEIVIYNIFAGEFSIQARVRIRPFDVMGTWLNETHILSAVAHPRLRTMQCLTEVVLNKSAQDIENIHQSTVTRAFLFLSNNLATVSYLQVADIARPIRQVIKRHCGCELKEHLHKMHFQYLKTTQDKCLASAFEERQSLIQVCAECDAKSALESKAKRFKAASPVQSGNRTTCFSFCSKAKLRERDSDLTPDPDPNFLLKSCGVLGSDTDSLAEPSGLRQYNSTISFDTEQVESSLPKVVHCIFCGKPILSKREEHLHSEIDSSSATSADEDSPLVSLPRNYKLLLCFTGQLSCTPHQIGVKIIQKEECSQVAERDISEQLHASDSNRPEVDSWDHKIELKGHGIGMTVSPCNRYLYVNVRKWIGEWQHHLRQHFLNPPPISSQVELMVIDLVTMEQVSTLTGHNSEPGVTTFFIHLSLNDFYVASGSGDACGYIWDRHYRTKIALLPHEDVVNCVAVNPRDPSMAVSVSDDKSIKIWRSKSFNRLLKGARPKARIKFRSHSSHLTKF